MDDIEALSESDSSEDDSEVSSLASISGDEAKITIKGRGLATRSRAAVVTALRWGSWAQNRELDVKQKCAQSSPAWEWEDLGLEASQTVAMFRVRCADNGRSADVLLGDLIDGEAGGHESTMATVSWDKLERCLAYRLGFDADIHSLSYSMGGVKDGVVHDKESLLEFVEVSLCMASYADLALQMERLSIPEREPMDIDSCDNWRSCPLLSLDRDKSKVSSGKRKRSISEPTDINTAQAGTVYPPPPQPLKRRSTSETAHGLPSSVLIQICGGAGGQLQEQIYSLQALASTAINRNSPGPWLPPLQRSSLSTSMSVQESVLATSTTAVLSSHEDDKSSVSFHENTTPNPSRTEPGHADAKDEDDEKEWEDCLDDDIADEVVEVRCESSGSAKRKWAATDLGMRKRIRLDDTCLAA